MTETIAPSTATNKPIAEFIINILDVKTTTVDSMQDVVKLVTWSITVNKGGLTETASNYTTELPTPSPEKFTPYTSITPAQLTEWVTSVDDRLPGIKAYLENRLDVELAKATLESKPLPWAVQPQAV